MNDPWRPKEDKAKDDSLTPMKRVNKINALLDHLPESQRASLLNQLESNAPQLISPKVGKDGKKPIDTPMRRAKAIARRLTRGELSRDNESPSEEIDLRPVPPLSELSNYYGKPLLLIYRASPLVEWLKALKIAEPELKEHLLIHLPVREKTALEEALRQLGPVKLSQAQEASQTVMRPILDLERKGQIQPLRQADYF